MSAPAWAKAKADQGLLPMFGGAETVAPIAPSDAYDLIINVHYAKRVPSISYAFGLFDGSEIEGVVTFGTPSSAPMRSGLLGPEMASRVLELNRLCLRRNRHNDATKLISASLKQLPSPCAIVSFADTGQGHVGTVYQAANFIYCGLSAKRTDWKIRGLEHLHGQSVADQTRGLADRVGAMRARYGADFYLADRSRKHRYVYFTGSKRERKEMLAALRYPVEPYPKADQ